MTDKFKDQDSMLPAATDEKKKAIVAKTGGKTQVIINPPEKVDPQRGYNENFKQALQKHSVIIEKKTELVLQSKAARADIPQETLEQVFKRGYKTLPLNSQLTREQYAMNRVNSFVAGGAAMVEDCDLLPIFERVGIKGTGGGARPHIKREKSPYNNKTLFHVVDAGGNVKHTTGDEFAAKKHLAQKYSSYMGEGTLSPMKRFEGTNSLVKTYKGDTPGQSKKDVAEVSKATLDRYVPKAVDAHGHADFSARMSKDDPTLRSYHKDQKRTAEKRRQGISRALDRMSRNVVEQGVAEEAKKGLYYYVNRRKKLGISRDKDNPKAPSSQDWKNAAKTAKEEVDLSELSNAVLARYKAKAGEQASAADKAGDFKKGNKRFSGIMKATNKQFDNDIKGAQKK